VDRSVSAVHGCHFNPCNQSLLHPTSWCEIFGTADSGLLDDQLQAVSAIAKHILALASHTKRESLLGKLTGATSTFALSLGPFEKADL
jgi:hypothetical protein